MAGGLPGPIDAAEIEVEGPATDDVGAPVPGQRGAPAGRGHGDDRSHFRPDIEGLRAVAIIAVLLFHVGLPGTPGGFIGVDVFYVISGFLITGLLRRELHVSGRIDLVTFYARRARRLLPAALLVIVVTLALSAAILSSLRFPDVAGDAAAAALYTINFRFALSATDYLGATAAPSPLQHYWSLAVEEQFYLVWPLLILVGSRVLSMSRLFWLVLGVGVGSFALSLVWTDVAAPWAFFSLPTRAWELAVGALIALGAVRLPGRADARVGSVVGLAGLAMIAGGVVLIDATTPYPGTAALLPVVGAALIILGGERADALPSRLLATAVPRWFGRISYSLYLWHWPLIILIPLALGRDDLPTRLVLGGVAIGLAALSTELVETPFRERRILRLAPSRSVALALGASLAVAVSASAFGGILPELPSTPPVAVATSPSPTAFASRAPSPQPTPRSSMRPGASPGPSSIGATEPPPSPTGPPPTLPPLPAPVLSGPLPQDLQPTLRRAKDDLPRSYADGCHLAFLAMDLPPCVYGDPTATTTVVLFGDSHAAQWLPALEAIAPIRGWRIVSLTKSGCPPVNVEVWNGPLVRVYRECPKWRASALDRIVAERPALVLVASASREYEIVDGTGRHPFAERMDAWRAGFTDVLRSVAQRAGRVVIIGDTPRSAVDPPECLASHADIAACDSARADLVDSAYADLEASVARDAGVDLVPATDWLCTETACPLVMGHYLVYRDMHHVTATFVTILAPWLSAAIGPVP